MQSRLVVGILFLWAGFCMPVSSFIFSTLHFVELKSLLVVEILFFSIKVVALKKKKNAGFLINFAVKFTSCL